MKTIILRTLKIVTIVVALVVILAVAAVGIINAPSVQNKLIQRATELLSEKLQTKVTIDSVHVGFFSDDICLYRLDLEDLQRRKLLQVDKLVVDLSFKALLQHEVKIEEVTLDGVRANIYKDRPDSAANYQFIIDAFSNGGKSPAQPGETTQPKNTTPLQLNLSKANLQHIVLTWNKTNKKGVLIDNKVVIGAARYKESWGKRKITVDSLRYITDNHLPHKRTGKPKRGWFDAGHLDVLARVEATILHADKDSVVGKLQHVEVEDRTSKLRITDLQGQFRFLDGKVLLRDMTIAMANTKLAFDKGEVLLPSKKKGRRFHFETSDIKGTTLLSDISHPFAPVLANFRQPLNLSTKFSGSDSALVFRDVVVSTPDQQLVVKAAGGIEGLKDKYQLNVHFNINSMTAKGNVTERIINQFTVRKFMMKQLQNLGTLHYKGTLAVKWKKEVFQGTLGTKCGNLAFHFSLDELNKYVNGSLRTSHFQLGKALSYPDVGEVTCGARFQFDISKPRTAQMRKLKGGKLAIGTVDATIDKVDYKKLKVSDITVNIVSDGAVAEGKIVMSKKLADVLCSFSFTSTDELQKTKIKPGIRFKLFGTKDKQDKDQAIKEKQAKKALKEKEKQAKKALREKEKQEKKERKEKEKQAKKELKEKKRQEKKEKKEQAQDG